MANKGIAWERSPTGRLISEGSGFLIDNPHAIKADTIVQVGNGYQPERRVTLVRRKPIDTNFGSGHTLKKYLCLSIIDAQALANDILAGRGVLADL